MKNLSVLIFALLVTACLPSNTSSNDSGLAADTIQVMVIGTYHFVTSNSDIVSLETQSVLDEQSQSELEALASSIATFNPTHVVVERETDSPDYLDKNYQKYGPAMVKENPNERVQIGYRIAHKLGLEIVHGLDEQSGEGEPDYFPYGKLQEHTVLTGQQDELEKMVSNFQTKAEAEILKFEGKTIANRLIDVNTGFLSSSSFYYELSQFDQGEAQPAAELQAYWFMRNAKIFSKLRNVTEPGDRVVVVYGAGHKFWLEHFVEKTNGYVSVDPVPYLERAK